MAQVGYVIEGKSPALSESHAPGWKGAPVFPKLRDLVQGLSETMYPRSLACGKCSINTALLLCICNVL